jgi:putative hydrolase of the HAD superfamily
MRDLFASAGRDLTDAEAETASAFFEEHYRRSWLLYSDVLPALESLRGYGRGVISNGCTERQTLKLRQMGIERYFQVIVVSQSAGAAKPSREIFFEACHRARVPAQHAVFVGDRLEEDALAARAAGLRAFWLDRRRTGAPAPVETIGALTDLAGKLDLRIAV